LGAVLDELAKIEGPALVRTNELGTSLDFRDGLPTFERTLQLFRTLRDSALDNVPLPVLQQLTGAANTVKSTFNQIQTFNPRGQANPTQTRDQLIDAVASQYHGQFGVVAPVVAYSVRKGVDFERLERDAHRSLEEVRNLVGEIRSTKDTAEATLKEVQRAAQQAGVAQHAVHFRDQATLHERRARWWLLASALTAIATFGYGAYNVWYYAFRLPALLTQDGTPVQLTVGTSVQLAVAKVLLFSILSFAVVWLGRTYRAEWHNVVVNQHRQNALSSFETFVKGATDEPTRNAVLLQATQSIFAPQSSGFVAQESDHPAASKILEIVRGFTPHGSDGN